MNRKRPSAGSGSTVQSLESGRSSAQPAGSQKLLADCQRASLGTT